MLDDAYAAALPPDLRVRVQPPGHEWSRRDGFDVHLLTERRPAAPARLLVLHGGGGHAGALWPLASALASGRLELAVPDLPGYGRTRVPRRRAVAYDDWVAVATAVAAAELARDGRPLVLVGASMGGMLAYDVAGRVRGAAAVVATCLLDPRDRAVRTGAARTPWLGRLGAALIPRARALDRIRVPMRWVADMRAIANDPGLARACRRDPLGGGAALPVRFLRTWFAAAPAVEPEAFRACPVILAHPADDRWTPVALSRRFFDRLSGPKELVLLEGAGHFPVERPGIDALASVVERAARVRAVA